MENTVNNYKLEVTDRNARLGGLLKIILELNI